VKTRGLYQCSACRTQASPIAGTIFASPKLKLRVWFRALYHLTRTKQGISSIELGRRLGVTQATARKIKRGRGATGKTPFAAAVTRAGCSHAIVKTGSGPKAAKTPAFKWVNTSLPPLATSRPPSPAPTGPSAPNTCQDTPPSSNTASTAATISRP